MTLLRTGQIERIAVQVRLGLLCLLALAATGCNYRQAELFPTEYKTVAVPIFRNQSFYRGVEFDLTEALTKELELRSPYKVVPVDHADTLLDGTIVSVTQKQLSRRRDVGLPEEMELTVMVDFQWKDQRTGNLIRERRGFASVGRYIPTTPVGEPLATAQHAAAERLAMDIVAVMRSDW